jgi:lipid II:glycine glycyltransferase (peptidoglycan interpeptide bridge formation enzyme)
MEDFRFIQNITAAALSVCDTAASFLQSALWGEFKSRFGWKAAAFVIEWTGCGERPLLALSRRLAPGLSFAYVPWGPELPADFPADAAPRIASLAELACGLRRFLPRNTAFIRFDPPWFAAAADAAPPLGAPFKRAAADIQPPDTALVDVTPPLPEILAAMKPKWRYNIGLAEKRGVAVQQPDERGLDVFYRLLAETAERDGIAIHGLEYYRTLFEVCREQAAGVAAGMADGALNAAEPRLYTAEHEGDALAAIVVLFRGKHATYLYGASSNVKRNLMAPYALQWRAIQDAKAAGCAVYDLFGIPPTDAPDHPMAGLYRFKTGFGGKIIHRPGSWDYAYRPLACALFSAAERLRKKMRDAKKR